ncbi:hypothetical protein [Paenibacillus whitsoniae]|uniref:Uncharacterized protein n=1 Tax=Paenibacillus whitsoniae TaxID=2496558 RepID=A0A3S0AM86_9BACL|nr:hypothetical protein [Paenibacillus whitsoniae]RTE07021.1 hypothetical protein EJQ19_21995 [Paenibacillus whitsoniae]
MEKITYLECIQSITYRKDYTMFDKSGKRKLPNKTNSAPVTQSRSSTAPFDVMRLQQTIGNRAVGQLLQRAIKKGRTNKTYKAGRKINSDIITKKYPHVSQTVIEEIQRVHLEEPDMTLKAAYDLAEENVRKSGKRVVGRGGGKITDHTDLISKLSLLGADMSTAALYITNHCSLIDTNLRELEFLVSDFKVHPSYSAKQVKTAVTDAFMEMPSKLIRTMSSFNSFAEEEVAAEKSTSSAWKGNQFEQWVDVNVKSFSTRKQRLSFPKTGSMSKARDSDGYDSKTNEIWDYKHVSGPVDVDQVKDYEYIIQKKVKSADNIAPTAVNYLFPDLSAAQANSGLKSKNNFNVWYIQPGMSPEAKKL